MDTHYPTRPGTVLTRNEIAWMALKFPWVNEEAAVVAVAIPWGESRGNTNAHRPEALNPSGGEDRGLVQFNSKAYPGIPDEWCYHPIPSMALLHSVSRGGESWRPWNYGPDHYGKVERTDLDLVAAADALTAPVNPFWKLHDANIDCYGVWSGVALLTVRITDVVSRPESSPYVSLLPPAPLKAGNSNLNVQALQQQLKVEGVYTAQVVQYYGTNTKLGVAALQQRFVSMGVLTPGSFVSSVYDSATRSAWDSLRWYAHTQYGR